MNQERRQRRWQELNELATKADKKGLLLGSAGIDAIELSGGTPYSGKQVPVRKGESGSEKEVYYLDGARKYKEKIGVPLMLVGGIRSYAVAERLVGEGLCDYISLSRPLICEPHLINRWKSGDTQRSRCRSDQFVLRTRTSGRGDLLRCGEATQPSYKPTCSERG